MYCINFQLYFFLNSHENCLNFLHSGRDKTTESEVLVGGGWKAVVPITSLFLVTCR